MWAYTFWSPIHSHMLSCLVHRIGAMWNWYPYMQKEQTVILFIQISSQKLSIFDFQIATSYSLFKQVNWLAEICEL